MMVLVGEGAGQAPLSPRESPLQWPERVFLAFDRKAKDTRTPCEQIAKDVIERFDIPERLLLDKFLCPWITEYSQDEKTRAGLMAQKIDAYDPRVEDDDEDDSLLAAMRKKAHGVWLRARSLDTPLLVRRVIRHITMIQGSEGVGYSQMRQQQRVKAVISAFEDL